MAPGDGELAGGAGPHRRGEGGHQEVHGIIPEKYEQVVVSIKTTLELKTISIEEVTDHLTAAVDHANKRVARTIVSGALLVTHEEWMASMKP